MKKFRSPQVLKNEEAAEIKEIISNHDKFIKGLIVFSFVQYIVFMVVL